MVASEWSGHVGKMQLRKGEGKVQAVWAQCTDCKEVRRNYGGFGGAAKCGGTNRNTRGHSGMAQRKEEERIARKARGKVLMSGA